VSRRVPWPGQLRARLRRAGPILAAARFFYALAVQLQTQPWYYRSRAPYLASLRFDEVQFGHYGNDVDARLRRLRRVATLKGKHVLVLGVGRGHELERWRREAPASLTALELLDYSASWRTLDLGPTGPPPEFVISDLRELGFASETFDVVASTGVLEHIADVPGALTEVRRVMKPGGVMFAAFGPLYRAFGGAHYLGSYEHMELAPEEFREFLVRRGLPEEREGLFFHDQGLFSRWTYEQYDAALRELFVVESSIVHLSPEGRALKHRDPRRWQALRQRWSETDLLVRAATVIVRKDGSPSPVE
jgi:SAM-dependent methyltransferase